MNKKDWDILLKLTSKPYSTQRMLAEECGVALGAVNRSLKKLISEDYLDEEYNLTEKANNKLKEKKPQNAIILAAGFGMRMVPINLEVPKGLLEVNGEILIERIIRQLHEVGIYEIYVVSGFLKEKFEYLIDKYGVELIINEQYAVKNNLYSLSLAAEKISNTYIIPCDIWCKENPFHKSELYSWYMVSDLQDKSSPVRINTKMDLVFTAESDCGNTMVGISYIAQDEGEVVRERLKNFSKDDRYDDAFWEIILYEKNRMAIPGYLISSEKVMEINTYEQLRELDCGSNQLKSDAMDIISEVFKVPESEITGIEVLKKGMTNRSFLFSVRNQRYIMRIPGEGTDQLINREEEADVYSVINGKGLCDDIVYMNPENGYKITAFLEGARVCDPYDMDDVKLCMKKLRGFHKLKLKVSHEFNIFRQIEFYESLWNGAASVYRDYDVTKKKIMKLKDYIESHCTEKVLTHIDAVPDNFLFIETENSQELRLIDWEYSGMQDPHVDIAMFCIYSLYDKKHIDELIQIYFENECDTKVRIKIYCYIACRGLLWSNWCEYKRNLGVEFGEYSIRQYRYAKEYSKIAGEMIEGEIRDEQS